MTENLPPSADKVRPELQGAASGSGPGSSDNTSVSSPTARQERVVHQTFTSVFISAVIRIWERRGRTTRVILVVGVGVLATVGGWLLFTNGVPCTDFGLTRPCACADGTHGAQQCHGFKWSSCVCAPNSPSPAPGLSADPPGTGHGAVCTVSDGDDTATDPRGACTAPADLAMFRDEIPLSDDGEEWGTFNDSKWLGRSLVWYETIPSPGTNDYFLRVHFTLNRGPRARTPDAYAGIYLDLNPPRGTASVSPYKGLQFRARHPRWPKGIVLLVHLATPAVQSRAYHEHNFTLESSSNEFPTIRLPFESFQQPRWYTGLCTPFDPTRVTHVAFVVKGLARAQTLRGYFDLDSVKFYGDTE